MAENAQKIANSRDRLIAEHSSDVIGRTDVRGVCTYVSPSVERVLGYSPSELIGRLSLDLDHPDDREELASALQTAFANGVTGTPYVSRVRRKDGTYVWLEHVAHPVLDASGRIVEIQTISRDVHARVVAEQELTRARAQFRETLARLPQPLLVHLAGRIRFVNAAFLALLGFDRPDEIEGRLAIELVHPDDRDYVARRLSTDPHETPPRPREHRILHKDGRAIVVDVTTSPVSLSGELAYLSVVHDLTQRKAMEAQLARAERLASMGRLAAAVGHEINNPLAYLFASVDLADAELDAARTAASKERCEDIREQLANVRDAAVRIRDLVRDLKRLAQHEDEPRVPVDVSRALDVATASAAHEIRHRARLTRVDEGAPTVLASEGRLVQVFVNLLVNAAQSIPEGDVSGNEIHVACRAARDEVVIEIADTGVGIPDEVAGSIFEPFFTTKRDANGTGLGLSIVQRIVASLGGTIDIESRRSRRGTLARVVLPACAGSCSRPSSAPPEARSPRMRVLFVDDEPRIASLYAKLLARHHDVTTASSGREAIERIGRERPFDAIVCDLQMSDLTGVDVFEFARARGEDLDRRIVFMTGGAFTERTRAFLARSTQPCLEKPFREADLLEALRAIASRVGDSDAPLASIDARRPLTRQG